MPVVKQYVNLPAGTTNIHGPSRDLRVAPNSVPSVDPGDHVEWWIEPDAGNTNIQYVSPAHRPRLQHKYTNLAAGGYFENTVFFPQIGGDKYVVKASKKGNRGTFLALDPFETWRKLYYSVYYVGAPALTMFNNLENNFKQAFADGYIEVENIQKTAALTDAARIDVTFNASFGRPMLHFLGGAAAPRGVIDLKPTGTGTITHKPFHAALLVVPDMYELKLKDKSFQTAAVVGTTTIPVQLFQEPGNPTAFVYQATVSWSTHPPQDIKTRLSVVGAPATYLSTFRWDLSTVPGVTTWLGHPGHKAILNLRLIRSIQNMGYSWSNFCVVRTIDGMTDVLQTFTHELGHGINQVVHREPRWNAAGASMAPDTNPKWHNDKFGGEGPHCSYNAVLTSAPPLPPGLTSVFTYGGAGLLCTMFFRGDPHVDPNGRFCPFCQPRVQRVSLDAATMHSQWNNIG